ncbi:Peptidoglycan O-acetyltransferase [Caballeronia temeraria]|uniref:Probable alginate O-acetylase AlgI n=1 Tax=Caballeronia temeraria TaxID=1777137 RepID=A0A158C265_9BURK|nr:Peptidoglycan O-acetyltransferase [Caballeronia temeraria]
MLFNTFEYWIFFAVVVVILAFLQPSAKRLVIVVASYIFYSFWDPRLCALLLASTAANYYLGLLIEGAPESRKKAFVTGAVVFNLVVLGFFKYFDFFANSLTALLGISGHPWALDIILPVGISFFTFEGIAYCCDVYRKHVRAVRSFVDFALFISFFPHLVAGPIIRPENFFPQVRNNHGLTTVDIKWGFCQIIKGLVKKIIFADYFAIIADAYFNDPVNATVAPVIGIIAFAMQIYFDFSGYTDIARGCAGLLGFRFPSNFERPYLAVNIADFWRRWHISLSTWLRDYLYIPLGGNRVSPSRVYVNLMIVMALGGLWHGASWNFMVWGIAHGAMLCVHRLWDRTLGRRCVAPAVLKPFTTALCVALTFVLVVLAWVPFRASDFAVTATILRQLASARVLSLDGATGLYWGLLAACSLWCLIDWNRRLQHWFVEQMPYMLVGVPVALAFIALQILGQFGLQIPFIYFKF